MLNSDRKPKTNLRRKEYQNDLKPNDIFSVEQPSKNEIIEPIILSTLSINIR